MSELQEAALLAGLFALRCIAPLVLTLAIGYIMNRLVDRWEAEDARLQSEGLNPGEINADVEGFFSSVKLPCWVFKNCDPADMAECPAYRHPGLPCWLAHLRSRGKLPEGCPDCPIYVSAWATD